MKTTKTKPKQAPAKAAVSSALDANPRKWLSILDRKGFSAIPHPFDGDPDMLAVYRVGVSYKPQPIKGTGTRYDGQTLHVMSMSLRHLAEDTCLNKDTCKSVLARLVEDGWAASIRKGKKGQRGTAAFVFFTAEQRIEPRVARVANVLQTGQSLVTPNVRTQGPLNVLMPGQVTPGNVRFQGNEVSQVLPERQLKVAVASSIAEPSTGSNPVLEREPEKPKAKPDPERAKEWDALFKVYDDTLKAERGRLYRGARGSETATVEASRGAENAPAVIAAGKALADFNALYNSDGSPKAVTA